MERRDRPVETLGGSLRRFRTRGCALTSTVCELSDEARLREVLGLYLSSPQKWQQLRALEGASRDRGIAVVDDGGVHPGLPGSMIRFANEFPELQSTGFFIAGFGSVVDYGVLPIALALGGIHPHAASRVLFWGLRQFASSRGGAALVLEGVDLDGRCITLSVSHPDPYMLTGSPAVATVR